MAVTKMELRRVITKLDDVRLELIRLRAQLLPDEKPTAREKRKIMQGLREIKKGQYLSLAQLRRELGL